MKKTVTKIKLIMVIAMIGLFTVSAMAQINNKVTINIRPGTYVNVNGTILNDSTTGVIKNLGTIIVSGDFHNDGTYTDSIGSNFVFNGTATQYFQGTSPTTFNQLTIAGTSGASNKEFQNSAFVTSTLAFDSLNKVILGADSLTLLSAATITGASDQKFIVTNSTGVLVKKAVPTGADFVFPIGDDVTSYKPAILNYTGTVDTFTVSVKGSVDPTMGAGDAECVQATWTIMEDVATGSTGTLTLQWDSISDEGASFIEADAMMMQNVNPTWNVIAGTPGATAGTYPYYTYAASNITDFTSGSELFTVKGPVTSDPTGISATENPICALESTTLSVIGGNPGGFWEWYYGSCGGTIIGTGPSIDIDTMTVSETIYVRGMSGGSPTTICVSLLITVNSAAPAQPGPITGNSAICAYLANDYYIAPVADATSYTWGVPIGWVINSGGGTGDTAINVSKGSGSDGFITVSASNGCGTSPDQSIYVTIDANAPAKTDNVYGIIDPSCPNTVYNLYCDSADYATNYIWVVPAGWTINAGQGTKYVTVTSGNINDDGPISVYAYNACDTSSDNSTDVTVRGCDIQLNVKVLLEGLCIDAYGAYIGNGQMHSAMDYTFDLVPKWGWGNADTVTVELRDQSDYNTLLYAEHGLMIDTTGLISFTVPGAYNSSYYVAVLHHNHLATSSVNTVDFSSSPVNYDFTTDPSKGYIGNAPTLRDFGDGYYAMYGGDITDMSNDYQSTYPSPSPQDYVVDMSDVMYYYDSNIMWDFGYVLTDLTGDGVCDMTDVMIAYDNNVLWVYHIR